MIKLTERGRMASTEGSCSYYGEAFFYKLRLDHRYYKQTDSPGVITATIIPKETLMLMYKMCGQILRKEKKSQVEKDLIYGGGRKTPSSD